MKSIITLILFLFVSNFVNSQSYVPAYGAIVGQVSQTNITTNLTEYEGLGVKSRGSVAIGTTLTWLKNKYLSYGYTAGQIAEDSYTYSGSTTAVKNLILTKVGNLYPNTYIIICGHYDSYNISNTGSKGTNDNGSGLASILEVARLLQNVQTDYSIKFINFSGEEEGLYGSKHFVFAVVNGTTPKMNIKLVLNIDEVGGVAGLTNDTVTCEKDTNGTPSTNNAASVTFTNELIACVGLYSPLKTFLDRAYASDYEPFQTNGEIITGLFETNETTHKHTATDLLVYMDPVYNYNVAKVAVGAMLHFSGANTLANENFENDFQIRFFPNPTKDILNINSGNLAANNYTFSIIDILGKTIFSKTIQNAKQLEKIDISGFGKGMYLGVLETSKNRITKKIVIE